MTHCATQKTVEVCFDTTARRVGGASPMACRGEDRYAGNARGRALRRQRRLIVSRHGERLSRPGPAGVDAADARSQLLEDRRAARGVRRARRVRPGRNRRMDEPAKSIVTADDPLDIHPKMHLYTGGPVEPTRAWILTAKRRSRSRGARSDDRRLPVGVGDAGAARRSNPRPIPACGWWWAMPGWGAGQLDVELAQGAWLLAPVQPDLIFETVGGHDVGSGDPPAWGRALDVARLVGRALGRLTGSRLAG